MKYFEVLFFKLLFGSYQTKIRISTEKSLFIKKVEKIVFIQKMGKKIV